MRINNLKTMQWKLFNGRSQFAILKSFGSLCGSTSKTLHKQVFITFQNPHFYAVCEWYYLINSLQFCGYKLP